MFDGRRQTAVVVLTSDDDHAWRLYIGSLGANPVTVLVGEGLNLGRNIKRVLDAYVRRERRSEVGPSRKAFREYYLKPRGFALLAFRALGAILSADSMPARKRRMP